MLYLVKLMLREEFRFHTSFSSRYAFVFFPSAILFFSFVAGLTSSRILEQISLRQVLYLENISVFIYGMSVGAFGFLGKQYVERRYGRINFLVSMPAFHPISYKTTFLGLYMRDLIYYISLMLLPMVGGILLSVPFTHFRLSSIGYMFVAILLSFTLGMSFSFFASSLYMRNLKVFIVLLCIIFAALLGSGVLHLYGLEEIIIPLKLQYSLPPLSQSAEIGDALLYAFESIILIILFTLTASLSVEERFESRKGRFEPAFRRMEERFLFARGYSTLLAKEFIDLKRSNTVTKMSFSFVVPLMFLSFTSWFVSYGLDIPVGFNTVFYAAMVGFFGVIIYSWLNNVDYDDYFETLPVSVPDVIRTRLFTFLILTSWISTIFVLAIGYLNRELDLLWLALPVMFIVSVYMVTATAYLTGLRTNSFLFDMEVLLKFSGIALLPDICLTILSFTIYSAPLTSILGIMIVCATLITATILLYKGIDDKWKNAEFGM